MIALLSASRTYIFGRQDAVMLADARVSFAGEESIEERCMLLADRHGLSPREGEVLVLLAKGRSAPFIQAELVLSQSTVKTHTRNIYRKLGVGGKQELLDAVFKSEG